MTVHILDRWRNTLAVVCQTPGPRSIDVDPDRGTCPDCLALVAAAGVVDKLEVQ